MSVSSSNRERHAVPGNGNGTNLPGHDAPAAALDVDKPAPGNGAAAHTTVRPDRHVNRLAEKTDEELLSAYRTGDRSSFAALVERYQRELFHFLVRFLGDRAAAEDI